MNDETKSKTTRRMQRLALLLEAQRRASEPPAGGAHNAPENPSTDEWSDA